MRPALVLLLLAAARTASADALDDYVRAQMGRQKIPGLSLAVCRDGKPVRAAGYGQANVEHQVPAGPETVYQSGSMGKQFTATAVMMLAEGGKLSIDDPVTKSFTDAPEAWKPITIRHLLTHTSGLKDYGPEDIDFRRDYTEDELVKKAYGLPLDFPPGTQWSYSNTGYMMLGVLIHKVSGQFYGDFLKERVFTPLGMTSTRIITEADIVPHRAAGYQLKDGALKNQDWVAPMLNTTADGSLYFTVEDLAKWDEALYDERLLKRASFEQMWTPVRLSSGATYPYGFGWGLDEQRGHRLIEHGGSWQGFRTAIARYVNERLTVAVLANLAEAEPEMIAHGIAGIVEPALALPDGKTTAADPDPARTSALRDVLTAWGQGGDAKRMAAGLRAARAGTAREKTSRKRTADRLQKMTGFAYLAEDDVRGKGLERRGETIARIAHFKMGLESGDLFYRFYLTDGGAVADFASEER
jgi:CubicO group peptidase (beta-lactamase class C family)